MQHTVNRAELLCFQRLSAFEHFLIIAKRIVGHILGKEVKIGFAQHLFRSIPREQFKMSIDEGVPPLPVF